MNISAPCEVEVCIPDDFKMRLSNDADVEGISAQVQAPEGFQYAGGAQVILDGLRSPSEPSINGRYLAWDLGPSARASRHIVINEYQQENTGYAQAIEK